RPRPAGPGGGLRRASGGRRRRPLGAARHKEVAAVDRPLAAAPLPQFLSRRHPPFPRLPRLPRRPGHDPQHRSGRRRGRPRPQRPSPSVRRRLRPLGRNLPSATAGARRRRRCLYLLLLAQPGKQPGWRHLGRAPPRAPGPRPRPRRLPGRLRPRPPPGLASGRRAGRGGALAGTPGWGHVFHGLQPAGAVVSALEQQAYAALAARDELERQAARYRQRHGRANLSLSAKLARAKAQEAQAIAVADDVATLVDWLREEVLALDGPAAADRRALYDFIVAELRDRAAQGERRLRSLS